MSWLEVYWFTPTILFGHYGAAPGGRAANAVLDTSSGTLAPGPNQDWRLPKLFSIFLGRYGPPRGAHWAPIGPCGRRRCESRCEVRAAVLAYCLGIVIAQWC